MLAAICDPKPLLTETVLSLAEAARRLPSSRGGRPVSPATLWRWVEHGVRLGDGSRVRLEALRLGGRWVTSAEALQRFAERQTPPLGDVCTAGPKLPRTPGRRERASVEAGHALADLGL